jgi:hypothetical protein
MYKSSKPRKKQKPRWCVTEMTIIDGISGDTQKEVLENYRKAKEIKPFDFVGYNDVKIERSEGYEV